MVINPPKPMKAISSAIVMLAGTVGMLAAVSGWSTRLDRGLFTLIFCVFSLLTVVGFTAWVIQVNRKD